MSQKKFTRYFHKRIKQRIVTITIINTVQKLSYISIKAKDKRNSLKVLLNSILYFMLT